MPANTIFIYGSCSIYQCIKKTHKKQQQTDVIIKPTKVNKLPTIEVSNDSYEYECSGFNGARLIRALYEISHPSQ